MMTKKWLCALPAAAVVSMVAASGCSSTSVATGTCMLDPAVACDPMYIGYSCSGTDRPDLIADTTKTVQGPLCSTTDSVNGRLAYCCTDTETSCGYDPRVLCMDSTTGFSCLGTNRPDSYNPNLMCEQGIHEYGLISYCCGQTTTVTQCMKNTNVPCPSAATLGFSCTTNKRLPTETDLGMNQSRSEVPLVCSLSFPDPGVQGQVDYCCYTPGAAPPGYTCLQNQLVGLVPDPTAIPGCEVGAQPGTSFGFACIGTDDTPEVDYPRMSCPSGPMQVSVNQSTLQVYCCNYTTSP